MHVSEECYDAGTAPRRNQLSENEGDASIDEGW